MSIHFHLFLSVGQLRIEIDFEDVALLRFSWTNIVQLVGINRSTLHRWLEETAISVTVTYSDKDDHHLDQSFPYWLHHTTADHCWRSVVSCVSSPSTAFWDFLSLPIAIYMYVPWWSGRIGWKRGLTCLIQPTVTLIFNWSILFAKALPRESTLKGDIS